MENKPEKDWIDRVSVPILVLVVVGNLVGLAISEDYRQRWVGVYEKFTGSGPADIFDGEMSCEVQGFEEELATTVDELEGKSGHDTVVFTRSTAIATPDDDATDDELIEFYTNEDNFVESSHQVPYDRIIECRDLNEIVDELLEQH